MIEAIKVSSAIRVVVVFSMVFASGTEGALKKLNKLDLQQFDAKRLKDFLDDYQQPKYCIRACLSSSRPQVITVEQTGQLILADKLEKQLKQGATLDCSFETMNKFDKIEIDNIEYKVLRDLLEEKFKFVLTRYLLECAPVMHEKVEKFIEEGKGRTINAREDIAHLLFLIDHNRPFYLENLTLESVKVSITDPLERSTWRTEIYEFYKKGRDAFLTDICATIENGILKDIVDVVAGAVENRWAHLSKTEGTSFLKLDVDNHYPLSLYLLGRMCKHEKSDVKAAQI